MKRGISQLTHAEVCKLSRIFHGRKEQCSDSEWFRLNGALKEEIEMSFEREKAAGKRKKAGQP